MSSAPEERGDADTPATADGLDLPLFAAFGRGRSGADAPSAREAGGVRPPTDADSAGAAAVGGAADAEAESLADAVGCTRRYAYLGEIARGGFGVVVRAYDRDLGREVALKILRSELRDHATQRARFLREARLTGGLEHPGVPPIHDVGRLGPRTPFFAMKLVRGRTLAEALAARATPEDGQDALLAAFRRLCETIAFAHARGVVHRDLKPANVMLGDFGEAQVMDWGVAKELAAPPPADVGGPDDVAALAAVDATLPGAVMGTPSYMAPEQARGVVDERTDVFALGLILVEILTGVRAYREDDPARLRRAVQVGDLAAAFLRLDAAPCDPGLAALARRCLAVDPAARPREAGAVATALATLAAEAAERTRRAELDAARERTKAAAERRARRRAFVFWAGLCGAVALAAAAWIYVAAAESRAAAARDAAHRVAADADWMRRAEALRARLPVEEEADAAFPTLLAEAGFDLARDDAALTELLRAPGPRRAALRDAVDAWWTFGLRRPEDAARRRRVERIVERGWEEPAFAEVVRRYEARDADGLAALAAEGRDGDSPRVAALLVRTLALLGREDAAVEFAVRRFPRFAGDFWFNLLASRAAANAGRPEAVRFGAVAAGLKPDVGAAFAALAEAHAAVGANVERAAAYRRAAALEPGDARLRYNFGVALQDCGRLDDARAEYEAALASDPAAFEPADALALLASRRGDRAEALRLRERAVAADPRDARRHLALGNARRTAGDAAGALAAYRAAVGLEPGSVRALVNLGGALLAEGRVDEALPYLRDAASRPADDPVPALAYARALGRRGETTEALAVLREARAKFPQHPDPAWSVALACVDVEDAEGAAEAAAAARRLAPKSGDAAYAEAVAAEAAGDFDRAAELADEAAAFGVGHAIGVPELARFKARVDRRSELAAASDDDVAAEGLRAPTAAARRDAAVVLRHRRRFADAERAFAAAAEAGGGLDDRLFAVGCALRAGDAEAAARALAHIARAREAAAGLPTDAATRLAVEAAFRRGARRPSCAAVRNAFAAP
jgi:Tfp pilus assembly protein PilF